MDTAFRLISCVCVAFILVLGIEVSPTSAAEGAFSYDSQNAWPSICVSGNTGRQSPINIDTSSVVRDSSLTEPEFSGWDVSISGTFHNKGHNVQFDPAANAPNATTRNHLGTYRLVQMHMHWGGNNTVGSEHLIDYEQSSLEIHFVHSKIDGEGDEFFVVGVFAESSPNAPIDGVWSQLDLTNLQNSSTYIDVTNFRWDSLLPASTSHYYFYSGSLTTPPCTEQVQFYIMKDKIDVPSAYLDYLRQINDVSGNPLISNYRNIQQLNGRVVKTSNSIGLSSNVMVSTLTLLLALVAGLFI